jgi:hypothetical protein
MSIACSTSTCAENENRRLRNLLADHARSLESPVVWLRHPDVYDRELRPVLPDERDARGIATADDPET